MTSRAGRPALLLTLIACLSLLACAGPPTGPPASASEPPFSSSPSPPSTPPSAGVTSAAQAAALVLASEPLFGGVGPLRPDLIGQCCWYEAFETGDGYEVTVELGWGDCMAGCIDRHRWVYEVGRDGSVTLIEESGPEPEKGSMPVPGSGPVRLLASLTAGPTCPVEQNPPDPACAPRPVPGAELIVRTPDGAEAARGVSDENGVVDVALPAGAYYLEPQAVEGLLGTPAALAVSALAGTEIQLRLDYDTGIR